MDPVTAAAIIFGPPILGGIIANLQRNRGDDDDEDADDDVGDANAGYGYDDGVDVDHGYSYGSDSCSSSYGSSGGERQTTLDEFD